ncbi:hypothetical protein ACIO02_27230 [Streptomyces sp. NPDC087568]|uniref:hypothetical protein n=1 Tax=unclassified Streptomyces TaxID=2593676 RepID=UPI0038114FDA
MPLRLLTDWEIQARQARLIRAEEAARRLAESEAPDGALRVAQRLSDQGAPRDLVERARQTAREDQFHAREQGAKAHARAERLHDQNEQTGQELHRRQQLSPTQRLAEATDRARQRSADQGHPRRPTAGPSAFAAQPADRSRQQGQSR